MNKTHIYGMLLFLAGIASGMLITWHNPANTPQEPALSIPHMTESIGENITYNLFLYNSGTQEMHIVSVEPIFNEDIGQILTSDDLKIPVNKILQPGSAIEIYGSADINNTNLTKTDILKIETVTEGFNVTSVTSCMLAGY